MSEFFKCMKECNCSNLCVCVCVCVGGGGGGGGGIYRKPRGAT